MNRIFPNELNMLQEELSMQEAGSRIELPNTINRMRALMEVLPRNLQDSLSMLVGQLNAAVNRERSTFQKLFDALPDGYVVTDDQYKIEHANAAAGSLLGIPPLGIYGNSMLDFFCPPSQFLIVQRLRLIAAENGEGGRWTEVPARLMPADKSEVPICLRLLVLRGDAMPSIRWMMRPV
jgi:PAS domain-containing protein